MAQRIVGLYDNRMAAQHAQQELMQAGFRASDIDIIEKPAGSPAPKQEESMWTKVKDFFGMDTDVYREAAKRGGTLVSVQAPENLTDRTVDILKRHHPVDVGKREQEWRSTGWQPSTTTATTSRTATRRTTPAADNTIPIVEEQLQVGKQRNERGGVRIYSHVTSKPVEKQVELREEHVKVQRRPADRPADAEAFRERTIEVPEVREEAVVTKQPRVVEEVVVSKEVQPRTETVKDTVRRTDVNVEQLEKDYRKHYEKTYAPTGAAFDQYKPWYDYGRNLAGEQQYSGREWTTVESEAQKDFERRNPGKWPQYREAVHCGYDRARTRR